jgi:hypothetical protein
MPPWFPARRRVCAGAVAAGTPSAAVAIPTTALSVIPIAA